MDWWKDINNSVQISEIKHILRLATPVVFAYTTQMLLTMITFFFIGHTGGTEELGGAALGNMLCNVFGFSVTVGIATAMDTLCSQAYGDNPNSPLIGVILQRAIAIMCTLTVPISVVWWNAEKILLMAQQHHGTSAFAGLFCRWMIPGILPGAIFECLKKYLQAQEILEVQLYSLFLGLIVNVGLNLIFTFYFHLKFISAPISMSLTNFCLVIFTVYQIKRRNIHKKTWKGWSSEAFKGWGAFLKLGVPGMLMLFNEMCSFEIVALASGYISDLALAAQTVALNMTSLTYMIPMGIGVAVNVRVGNLLGASMPEQAKKAGYSAIVLSVFTSFCNCFLLVVFRKHLGYIFSDDHEVVELVSDVFLICGLFQIFDGIQTVESGIIRGLGKQNLGAIFNFVGYYAIGLPVGFYLSFKMEYGIFGIWWALSVSLLCCMIFYSVIIYRSNWSEEAESAHERLRSEGHGAFIPKGNSEESLDIIKILQA